MIKKYCSCVRAVQNTGKNSKEIDDFVREITGGKFYTTEGRVEGDVDIVRAKNDFRCDTCVLGFYIIATKKSEYQLISRALFEKMFEEYNEQQANNHTSKPSSFSLRNLVMRIAPKHRYNIKRLEEYDIMMIS